MKRQNNRSGGRSAGGSASPEDDGVKFAGGARIEIPKATQREKLGGKATLISSTR